MDNKLVLPTDVLISEVAILLSEGKEVVLKPKGRSMEPSIREGRDNVVLRKKEGVEAGDIVLADVGGRYVLHRVISVGENRLILMGDGNLKGTESCGPSDVLGTVVAIESPRGLKEPGKGRLWVKLKPFRRILLAIDKRILR